jgi:hypothetical protein
MKKDGKPDGDSKESKEVTCGVVMPISALDGLPAEHWLEVQSIIKEAVSAVPEPRFVSRLVSDADEIGVIQKRIVQSLYNSDIIVCDVSGKNPNVMFELGLRLAFDKPTVIVKDDKTDYSFDTGIIEHVSYPRDLRFARIVDFKRRLGEKILATYRAAQSDPNHSPFLKNFGQFKVASLNETEVSTDKAILELLSDLQRDVAALKTRTTPTSTEESAAARSPFPPMRSIIVRALVKWEAEGNKLPPGLTPELHAFIMKETGGLFVSPSTIEDTLDAVHRLGT